jgi:hypothetical protein
MQSNFATDGLVWADPEMVYDMQIRGYVRDIAPFGYAD